MMGPLERFYRLGMNMYFDSEGGGGGEQIDTGGAPAKSGADLEDYTNQKLGGEEPSKNGAPEGGEEPSGEQGGEEGSGGAPPEEDEPGGEEPEGQQQEPSGEEPAEEPSGEEGPEGDQQEGEPGEGDDEFYYDPAEHVDGEPAHSNKFRTKEQAVFAAINKAEMLKEQLDKMDEDGIDRGAIKLPDAVGSDPEQLGNMLSYEQVQAMDDEDIRSFLNQSDASRQRLETKAEREKSAKQVAEAKDEFEQTQVDLYNLLTEVTDNETLAANQDKFEDPEAGREFIENQIEQKVEAELSEARTELETYMDKVEEGEIEVGPKEFHEEIERRKEEIGRRAEELRENYQQPALEKWERLNDLAETVEEGKELTPAERKEKMWGAFDEMQRDLGEIPKEAGQAPELDLLADTPEARAELVAAKNWAIENAADYNGLLHPADWREAIEEGWPAHKANVKAGKQKKQLSGNEQEGGGEQKKGSGEEGDEDIPKPGDQRALETEGASPSARNRKNLDKLEEMTNAKVGV